VLARLRALIRPIIRTSHAGTAGRACRARSTRCARHR
jgi:hypothetical protein